jgi:hypothetical protein
MQSTRGKVVCNSSWKPCKTTQGRAEIELCLERNQIAEMRELFQRLQRHLGEKTHDEKLAMLLESLKPYCSLQEFANCRTEAFLCLRNSGFRQARDFVVRKHDELKNAWQNSRTCIATMLVVSNAENATSGF